MAWNATCGLSQLAILPGDPVAIQIFKYHDSPFLAPTNGLTSTEDIATPICLPLIAEYNGYGSVEKLEKTRYLGYLWIHLQRKFATRELFFAVEPLVDSPVKSLLELIASIETRRVHYSRGEQPPQLLGFMLMHYAIYKFLVEHHEASGSARYTREEIITYLCSRNSSRAPDIDTYIMSHFRYMHDIRVYETIDFETGLAMADAIYLGEAMEVLRRGWMPQFGTGSHKDNYAFQAALAHKVIDFCQENS